MEMILVIVFLWLDFAIFRVGLIKIYELEGG